MHSPNTAITDDELQKYITHMRNVLNEPELQDDKDAKAAIKKLIELQNNDIYISMTDEIELLKEKQSSIERGQIEHSKQIEDIATKQTSLEVSKRTADIEMKSMKRQLQEQRKFPDKIQLLNDKICDMASVISQYKDDQCRLSVNVNDLKSAMELLHQEMDVRNEVNRKQFDEMQTNMKSLEDKIARIVEESSKNEDEREARLRYLKQKQALQKMLTTIYEGHFSTLLVSPVRDELRTNIDDVFVELVLCNDILHKKVEEGVGREGDETYVELYKDTFFKENNICKNIYLLGDAGMGKTTWCTKLLRTWVCAQKKMSEGSILTQDLDEDQMCMLNFDVVAFVPLRHACDESLILDMIENQLFSEVPEMKGIFLDVLKTEPSKCLIVLDGLDEWSKPLGKKFAFSQNQNIPGRNRIYGCPILTTSRPWKIYSIGLKDSEMDRAVKLLGIKDRALMAKKMITKMNCLLCDQSPKRYEEFDKCFKDFQQVNKIASLPFDGKFPLWDFMNVPLILVIMICLWHESGKIETSYAGNYWAMIGYLIQYTETQKEVKQYKEKSGHHSILKNCPEAVRRHVHKYMNLISKLSKFAFESVFKYGLKSYLVFDENTLQKVLSKEEVQTAVQLGILSQSKAIGKALSRMTSLSFLHKSLQEFFAAMHIVISAQNGKNDAIQKFETYCSDGIKLKEMENVVIFLCGLDPKIASKMSFHIASLEVSEARRNEYDNLYMYMTYNLPLKCAIQVHALDSNYPSKEFPIHTKHLYIENSDQYRPILSFMYRILKANIGNINTVAINTGLMYTDFAGTKFEYAHHMRRSSLAQEHTEKLTLPSAVMEHHGTPNQLTDCILYGLDLSNLSDSDLKKIEKSFRGLHKIRKLHIGKICGFEQLHLDLSNCPLLDFFSLEEMKNTHIKLNFSKLEMVLLEKGVKCSVSLSGKTKHSCMHETYQKDSKLCIIARKMINCDVKISFSCFLAEKLVVESCLKHSIEFDVSNRCPHQTVSINTFAFEKNKLCSMKGTEEMIIEDVSIQAGKENPLDIPMEQLMEHAKSVSVQLWKIGDYIFKSSRIEELEIKLSEDERKDLDIISKNMCKLYQLRSLKIVADKFDPTHILKDNLAQLQDVEMSISEENFSRNTWQSLLESFGQRQSLLKLKINDSECRSIVCTRDEKANIDIHCTQLVQKDLKSIFSIINKKFEGRRIKSLDIQANAIDISVLKTIQQLTLLKHLKINLIDESVTPVKALLLIGPTSDSLQTFSCRNISSGDLKNVISNVETIETFKLDCQDLDESVYAIISKIKKIKHITLRFSKGCDSFAAEQRILDLLKHVNKPGYSSFCFEIEDKKLLKLQVDALECQKFSEKIVPSILSFVALPSRYMDLLQTLEIYGREIDTQVLSPVALLKELTTLKLKLSANIFHDRLLETLHTTLKKLAKLRNLDVSDGSLKCTFQSDESSLSYVRDNTCRAQIKPEMSRSAQIEKVFVENAKRLELECVNLPLRDFKWVVSFVASFDVTGNNLIKIFRLKTKMADKTFPSIGCLNRFAESIEKITEEQYLQGDFLKC